MSPAHSSAVLVGKNLASFAAGMSAQDRQDIKDCLLYAELRANEKYDRQTLWASWMNRYQRELVKLGFVLNGILVEGPPIRIWTARDFNRVTFRTLEQAGSRRLVELAQVSFEAMKTSAHAKMFLASWFSSGRSESFQVVPCEKTADGDVQVMVCGLNMITDVVVKGMFFWKDIYPEMTIRINGGSFVLNPDAYAQHRERVRAQLGDDAQRYITELEL
jgi:hypothetical protein